MTRLHVWAVGCRKIVLVMRLLCGCRKIVLVMRGERLPKVKGHTERCDCHTLIIITCKVRVVCVCVYKGRIVRVCIHRQDGDGAYNACGVC